MNGRLPRSECVTRLLAGLNTTGSGQVPDVSLATTDVVFGSASILLLTKQLDSFRKKDLFLGKFRMLSRSDRRRGGVPL